MKIAIFYANELVKTNMCEQSETNKKLRKNRENREILQSETEYEVKQGMS